MPEEKNHERENFHARRRAPGPCAHRGQPDAVVDTRTCSGEPGATPRRAPGTNPSSSPCRRPPECCGCPRGSGAWRAPAARGPWPASRLQAVASGCRCLASAASAAWSCGVARAAPLPRVQLPLPVLQLPQPPLQTQPQLLIRCPSSIRWGWRRPRSWGRAAGGSVMG
jgi:hypothetical protein